MLGLAGLLIGLWVLTSHHHATPYSMSSDARPRLPDGTVASDAGINVADAVARQPAHLVAIHGYFEAAADDWPYLCARLNGTPDCRGVPRLRIAGSIQWLLDGPHRLRGLETGCCAIGSWAPRPLVLRGTVRSRTLFLQAPSPSH